MSNVLIESGRYLREVLRAVETEPVDADSILGASGLEHSLQAIGVDPGRKRMVVISGSDDARTAALSLADLQNSFKAVQIVMARVVPKRTPQPAGTADAALGLGWIASEEVSDGGPLEPALREQGVLQYFLPAPDHLALALIDRWQFATIPQVVDQLVRAPDAGHPFGPPELVKEYESFTDLIQELQRMGLVETAAGQLRLTETGKAVRNTVQAQPREALATKLLNRLRSSLGFQPIWLPVIRGQVGAKCSSES